MLAARFNRAGHEIVDHHTYVIASDGDLQEGVSSEAVLARRPPRPRPADRRSTTTTTSRSTGDTALAFSEDVRQALRGLRLARAEPGRGHRARRASSGAIEDGARASTDRPSLIIVRTHIGYGSPEQAGHRTARTARRSARRRSGSPRRPTAGRADEPFYVPDEALAHFREASSAARSSQAEWERALRRPTAADAPRRGAPSSSACIAGRLPDGWDADVPTFEPGRRR